MASWSMRILAALGIAADAAYVASAMPRHMPMPDWAALGEAGLGEIALHHVALAAPQRLIVFGSHVSSLLGHDPANSSGFLHNIQHEGAKLPILAAPGLDTLLRRPRGKARLWQALTRVDWNQRDVTSVNLKRIAALALAGCALTAPGLAAGQQRRSRLFPQPRRPLRCPCTADCRRADLLPRPVRRDRPRDWAKVQALFAQKTDGPLHQVARAEYYLAAGSPKIEGETLGQWLAGGTSLPQAEQIAEPRAKSAARLPCRRCPRPMPLVAQPNRAKRIRPRETGDGTMPGAVAAAINGADQGRRPRRCQSAARRDRHPAFASCPRRMAGQGGLVAIYIENDDASAYAAGPDRAGRRRAVGRRGLVDCRPGRLAAG